MKAKFKQKIINWVSPNRGFELIASTLKGFLTTIPLRG